MPFQPMTDPLEPYRKIRLAREHYWERERWLCWHIGRRYTAELVRTKRWQELHRN